MRRAGALGVVVAGLLLAALLPAQVTASGAEPATGTSKVLVRTSVTLRLAPPVVTWRADRASADPTGLVAQVSPVRRGARLVFQEKSGAAWTTLSTLVSDTTGRAYLPLEVTGPGVRSFRVVQQAGLRYRPSASTTATLRALSHETCAPARTPVDGDATGEAYCLAARLDRWRSAGLMGVGQQLNVSSQDFLAPLQPALRTAVVGFDLEELAMTSKYQYPFDDTVVRGLMDLSADGSLLTASWHATNPWTGGPYNDTRRNGRPLSDVLSTSTDAGAAFWADFDEKMALLKRFQEGDAEGDGNPVGADRTAIVFRPLHEANGGFFWWGKPSATVYRQLWTKMQSRAAAAGVHNLLWAYSFNLHTAGVADPGTLVPTKVDLAGLDSYDPEFAAADRGDKLGLTGYSSVAAKGVPRMALTEVGPHGSRDGSWNPSVITRTVRSARLNPLWAMLWFDDGTPTVGSPYVGKKQLASLAGGRAWLAGCFNALCYLR